MPIDSVSGLPVMSIHNDPFELKGSYATSGLDLVYTSSNSAVLQVTSDGKLKGISEGTVTVTMSQPGDSYFDARHLIKRCNSRLWEIIHKPSHLMKFLPWH